jgi:hypothetical protein
MSNPVDEYLGIRKQAFGFLGPGFGSQVSTSMREGAAQAIGQGAVGLAATGIGVAALKTYRALRKRNDFKKMLESNPDLASFQEQDPLRFNAHYNSLRVMNPGYAEDPIISGSMMRQMSMHPQFAGKVLMESMESASRTAPGPLGQFSLGSKIAPDHQGDGFKQETSSSYRF